MGSNVCLKNFVASPQTLIAHVMSLGLRFHFILLPSLLFVFCFVFWVFFLIGGWTEFLFLNHNYVFLFKSLIRRKTGTWSQMCEAENQNQIIFTLVVNYL